MSDYRTSIAYQHLKVLAVACARAAARFPSYERFALADQLRRAAYSAVLNAAEGISRSSLADKRRLLDIARSSQHEVRVILDITEDLAYLDDEALRSLVAQCDEAGRTLYGYFQMICEKLEASKKRKKAGAAVAIVLLLFVLIS